MASFRRLKGGKWQAQVSRGGVRKSASFRSKAQARDWAARCELTAAGGAGHEGCLGDLFDRYARNVSPKKRGARWEIIRLEKLKRDALAGLRVRSLAPGHFADWRDRRLAEVLPATVRREMELISAVLTAARKEWGLLSANPVADVSRPAASPPRDRRVSDEEIDRLVAAVGDDLSRPAARAVHAFRFAIATAMRGGEIVGLVPDDVDRAKRVATLRITKNGDMRRVPLSKEALRLLDMLPVFNDRVFGISSQQRDSLFRLARKRAGIEGLTFHDSRHEAVTRLSRKIDVLDLARITGHRDPRKLLIYYNPTAEEMAARLD